MAAIPASRAMRPGLIPWIRAAGRIGSPYRPAASRSRSRSRRPRSTGPGILGLVADLREADANPDPIEQFRSWFDEALELEGPRAEAIALATATPDGIPSVRMVLLRGADHRGFVFFTNYRSAKGRELEANPRAAFTAYWPALHRQVRVAGSVQRVAPEESDAYWRGRPHDARLAAAASDQSAVLPDRAALDSRFAELAEGYAGSDVPRPDHWGGYRVIPRTIELWQGRDHRLHDRLRYVAEPGGAWRIERLAP